MRSLLATSPLLLLFSLASCDAGTLPAEPEPVAPARSAVPPPAPMRAAVEKQLEQQPAPAMDQPGGGSCCGSSECRKAAGGGCGCRARGVRCGG